MNARLPRILIVLAGVMGADGVMLAAASAHQPDAARLASASSMLLFHAAALLGTVALAERGVIHPGIGIFAGWGLAGRWLQASAFRSSATKVAGSQRPSCSRSAAKTEASTPFPHPTRNL